MSREDYNAFLKKFWVSVASGLLILVISAVVANSYVAKATTDRSLRNENEVIHIKEDLENYATKGEDDNIHALILRDIRENKNDIKAFRESVDEIKDLILDLHAK